MMMNSKGVVVVLFERDKRSSESDRLVVERCELVGIGMGSVLGAASGADVEGGRWFWPKDTWTRHVLVLGAPGGGKTESVLRMADGFAGSTFNGLPVKLIYIDGKGDAPLAARFGGIMAARGRPVHFFPEQLIDAWRGDWRAVRERLMQVIPFATDGGATWYRDIAGVLMEYVCSAYDEPPRSSEELFRRFAKAEIADNGARHPLLASIDAERVRDVMLRYQNFFSTPGLVFDGDVGFEDIDTGYVRVDSSVLGVEKDQAMCMLFADFVHYCKVRKPREQLVVLVMDEFSAIASAFPMDRIAEELRGFNVGLVFVPQSLEGMGSEEQSKRLVQAVRLKMIHRYEGPQPLVELAGKVLVPEYSIGLDDDGDQEGERLRWVEKWCVPPEVMLGLKVGEAVVIREGRAVTVKVDRLPECPPAEVPAQEPIDRDYGRWPGLVGDGGGGESAEGVGSEPRPPLEVYDEAAVPPAFVIDEGLLGGEE